MVRRSSPVLSALRRPEVLAVLAPSLALAYLLLAPGLPATGAPGLRLDAALGTAFVVGAVLAVAPLTEAWPAATLLLLGSGILALALDSAEGRAAATLPEALVWCAGGLLFARAFAPAALALGVPLLLAGLDLAGVIGSGSIFHEVARSGDFLTLELPAWGGGQAAVIPSLTAGVLGALGAWGVRHGYRMGLTALFAIEGAVLAVIFALPTIAILCVAMLLPNVGRLVEAVRADEPGT